jgi:hypothetical protein
MNKNYLEFNTPKFDLTTEVGEGATLTAAQKKAAKKAANANEVDEEDGKEPPVGSHTNPLVSTIGGKLQPEGEYTVESNGKYYRPALVHNKPESYTTYFKGQVTYVAGQGKDTKDEANPGKRFYDHMFFITGITHTGAISEEMSFRFNKLTPFMQELKVECENAKQNTIQRCLKLRVDITEKDKTTFITKGGVPAFHTTSAHVVNNMPNHLLTEVFTDAFNTNRQTFNDPFAEFRKLTIETLMDPNASEERKEEARLNMSAIPAPR